MKSVRIKYILPAAPPRQANGACAVIPWGNCEFHTDPALRDYDWLVVYDDFPRFDQGCIHREEEPLACPREHTILVTQEPPTIKRYPRAYTRQFGYVLTTHTRQQLPHPHHRVGRGCVHWQAGYPLEEVLSQRDYPKSRLLSTVCSAKQMKHTEHYSRYRLTRYLAEHLPELDWYGRNVRELKVKYDALNPYKYHIAVENYIAPNHWTDKISDPLLGLCLTFYAGDPRLSDILPPESFIPIPLHDPERALSIITNAIASNEYERRLPAIREARRLIITRYNIFQQVADVISKHQDDEKRAGQAIPIRGKGWLKGRHALRRDPRNWPGALAEIVGHCFHRKQLDGPPCRTVRLSDGLGNQLFQYAFALAVQRATHDPVLLDRSWFPEYGGRLRKATRRAYALSAYRLSLETVEEAQLNQIWHAGVPSAAGNGRACRLREQEIDLAPAALPSLPCACYLRGFFQQAAYPQMVREQLLRDLTLPDSALNEANRAMLASIQAAGEGATFVHLRRGDYAELEARGEGVHRPCPLSYYQQAEQYLEARETAPLYLFLFTDDPAWAREHYRSVHPMTLVDINDAAHGWLDIHLMRHCHHAIIANSTFSWWGAWLMERPGRIVIAPARWLKDSPPPPGLLPDDWITL